jgi:hypothetical protein
VPTEELQQRGSGFLSANARVSRDGFRHAVWGETRGKIRQLVNHDFRAHGSHCVTQRLCIEDIDNDKL